MRVCACVCCVCACVCCVCACVCCVCAILTRSRGRAGLSVRLFFRCVCVCTICARYPHRACVREFFFSHRTLRFAPRLVNTTLRVGCTLRVHVRTPAVCSHHLRWVRFAPKNNVIASLRFARLGNVACRAQIVAKILKNMPKMLLFATFCKF